MGVRNSVRKVVVVAAVAAVSVAAAAQNQSQGQQNQQNQAQAQPTQSQNQQQNQQAQPQQKKGFWQRLKDSAAQGAQNTVQQGTNAAQGTVQQGTSAVQNGAQQVQNGVQQGAQGALPANQGSGAFSGGGGGSGSCGPSCFDAGPFQANVQQMTMSQQGAWHVIRMDIQFHNSTNQPLIIAYHDGSMVMVDNNGSTYVPAGGQPGELQGMGIDRGNQTDSQFVLAPGQTGNALFSTARWRDNTSPVGTGYSYNLTIDELQAQNGAMAIPVRTYNLNFPSLVPGTSKAAAFPTGSSATGLAAGSTGTSSAGRAAPAVQGGTQSAGAPGRRGTVASPAQLPTVVNGRPAVTAPASTTVNNAAMKSNAATTAKPSAAVKPIPTTTKTTTPPKKTTPDNTPATTK